MALLIETLSKKLRLAGTFNPDVQVSPACILWPDRDRQWESALSRLQAEMPELFVLGDYDPDQRCGPAIWLRCVLAGTVEEDFLSSNRKPIFYLPGVSRQDLRAVESCPDHLKPLAELQYRGVIWSQINAKDWTILAFLKSDQGGLALDVAQDNETKQAMQVALTRLLDEDLELLQGKRLDKDYFNALLSGGDPVRDVLQWIDQGDAFREARESQEWQAFVEVSKSLLAFDPSKESILSGALKLAQRQGPWKAIWERYCEAPKRFPNIPAQIRKCKPPRDTLQWHMDDPTFDGWPQWNENRENALQKDLFSLEKLPPHEARERIVSLDKDHGRRRSLVWAELDQSPLALALEHLAVMAQHTSQPLTSGSIEDLTAVYKSSAWLADKAMLVALSCVSKAEDVQAVTVAIRQIYLPWADDSARYLQQLVDDQGYPGKTDKLVFPGPNASECVIFVDGLRFDIAQALKECLAQTGFQVDEQLYWGALPSVTATGKPAVSPVRELIAGQVVNSDFEPSVRATGQSLKGGHHFRKLLLEKGWTLLGRDTSVQGEGNAWCECGNIDHEGHSRGWKLAKQINSLVQEIHEHVESLMDAGWNSIKIVTDHGWVLMPEGLPKVELPGSLLENRWGRCAALKQGATTDQRLYPWHWNPDIHFVLADGIGCFRRGEEYAHGGLSLQECLLASLHVTHGSAGTPRCEITDVVWKGLRCTVGIEGDPSGLSMDVRTHAGDPSTSVVLSIKSFKGRGMASVLIENEDTEGQEAYLVILDAQGEPVTVQETLIGGERS